MKRKKFSKRNRLDELKMKPEYVNDYELTIGGQLANIRKLRGISQQELADELQVNRVSIANVEIGKRKISMPLLYRICDMLGYQVVIVPKYNHELKEKREYELQRREQEIIRTNDTSFPE